eukprot:5960728-Pyramimonas_sp.AAC.1
MRGQSEEVRRRRVSKRLWGSEATAAARADASGAGGVLHVQGTAVVEVAALSVEAHDDRQGVPEARAAPL